MQLPELTKTLAEPIAKPWIKATLHRLQLTTSSEHVVGLTTISLSSADAAST